MRKCRGKERDCLVPRPHYSARPKRFGSRGSGEEDVSRPFVSDTTPSELTEKARENAVRGLGKEKIGLSKGSGLNLGCEFLSFQETLSNKMPKRWRVLHHGFQTPRDR